MNKALLFINGVAPVQLPDVAGYSVVACSDGAFHYLKTSGFPLAKLSFISGDFDSHSGADDSLYADKFIYTPDQDKTDFHKSLEIILERGCKNVDVYGGSGGEMDHFLGNLHTAYLFKNQLDIVFFDEFSTYFFAPKNLVIKDRKNCLVSLLPFPEAYGVYTSGLNWELNGEDLALTTRIGSRNFAASETAEITRNSGELVVFIGHTPRF